MPLPGEPTRRTKGWAGTIGHRKRSTHLVGRMVGDGDQALLGLSLNQEPQVSASEQPKSCCQLQP